MQEAGFWPFFTQTGCRASVSGKSGTGEIWNLPCDGAFVCLGGVPETGLFQGQAALDEQGYILANETTATNLPGVFAVGDVRTKLLRGILTAAADGAVAAQQAERYIVENI